MAATLWTRDEETRLVQELRDGLTVDDIATAHQRTALAILARASRMTPDELPADDAQAQTGPLTRAQRTEWLREQLHTNPAYDWAAHLGETRRRRYAEVRSLAPRTGAIWTADEDAQVLAATAAGVSNVELAAQLQRSAKSTARRAWRLTQSGEEAASSATGDVDSRPAAEEAPPGPASQTPASQAPTSQILKSPAPWSLTPSTTPRSPEVDPVSSSPRAEAGHSPSAHGQPWTEDETFQLMEELRQGLSADDVAAAHGRSVRAINGRAATVLTHLTGSKHALAQDSAEQLRTRLTRTATTAGEHDVDRAAIAVVHDLLGATQVDA
ncbi:hypothetical protein [Kineococcus sp. R86509]|uniref:hypothetical protein n=1 Tax=Kineococcus sp. R86509 TaxID=3093851 RepID=UPI0036D3328D